ncbi:hypothetical protein QZQ97_17760 [Serratia sp. root2]|uniref:hypothetical protein n=1 Tax=Serratia sp. root2 TaxID=3059676 RepID=UPI002891681C|nr:hypothetical protein [Serratia sp. root2]MDT3252766.1 hypothetical protein [Serratia sp. root2]
MSDQPAGKRISELNASETLGSNDVLPVAQNDKNDTSVYRTQGVKVATLSDHILGQAFRPETGEVAAALRDESLFSIFEVEKTGGFGTPDAFVGNRDIENNAFYITTNTEGRRIECDPQGFEFQPEDVYTPTTPTPPTPPDNSLIERDNRNKLASMLKQSQVLAHDIAGMIWDYCIVLVYGQSLGSGMEGWPALTKVAREVGNILMVGNSVRGSSRNGTYMPLGENIFQDLRAVVQSTANPALALSDQEVAVLDEKSTCEGESLEVSAIHFWRELQLQMQGATSNPDRKIIVVNCCVAGRSIEQLKKGAQSRHYENRVLKALNNIKSLVDAKSAEVGRTLTCGIVAGIYIGNEWNYLGTDGTTKLDEYKVELGSMGDTIASENQAIFGTNKRPVFITTQTGDVYTRDSTNLSIGTAHIELQNERDNFFCAGPNYPVPSKPGGHRDPNGYRWLGQKIGQVLHHTIDLRRKWFPMHALNATYSGKEALVDHMVMRWPVAWRETFSTITPTMYQNKGYRLVDAVGAVTITKVEIAADTITRIIADRDLVAPVFVWYAGQTTYSGDGNLYDSDSTLSLYNYEYHEGSGQFAAANLPTYVNKPYPLNNACAAYRIEAKK